MKSGAILRWLLVILVADLDSPATLIGQDAGLNTGDGFVQLQTQFAGFAALDGHDLIHVAQLGAHHIRIVGGGSSNLLKSTK